MKLSLSPHLIQILAGGLSAHGRGGDLRQFAVPGADVCTVHGQVRHLRQDERGARGTPALLLHDGRQDGQDAGAARELHGSGPQSRHRGQQREKTKGHKKGKVLRKAVGVMETSNTQ